MITRYWHTVRYLRGSQLLARVQLRAAKAVRRYWPATATRLYDRRVAAREWPWRDRLLGEDAVRVMARLRDGHDLSMAQTRATDVGRGTFHFLNQSGELGWPIDWSASSQSQLWRYHLHYFDVLVDLPVAPSTAMAMIEDWIRANPLHGGGATPDAWHPYVVSLRMVNWMAALTVHAGASVVSDEVRRSLVTHALFLERNLETDVGGNHLLKNLKAMVFAGCFWSGTQADLWRKRYAAAFVDALSTQLLDDGSHYELSPMYHCQVMADAIEVAAVLRTREPVPFEQLSAMIAKMDAFLPSITHPDGGIALFNDSTFGMTVEPGRLHEMACTLDADNISAGDRIAGSGYVTIPDNDASRFLVADAGAVCPDDLPAHAHADLLSYEVSVDGQRIIVDSGVGQYAPGDWRQYYRSTRAHNTIVVDGEEQSDCWGSFRVGRRARPIDVTLVDGPDGVVLSAGHTGYDRLSGRVRHHRRFQWVRDGGFWLILDQLTGDGVHAWESLCHLHPDAAVEQHGPLAWRLTRGDVVLDLCAFEFDHGTVVAGQSRPLQGWYADRFGPPRPAPVVVLTRRSELPATCGYVLVPRSSGGDGDVSVYVSGDSVVLQRDGHSVLIALPADAATTTKVS